MKILEYIVSGLVICLFFGIPAFLGVFLLCFTIRLAEITVVKRETTGCEALSVADWWQCLKDVIDAPFKFRRDWIFRDDN
jgi:hypothetical protein